MKSNNRLLKYVMPLFWSTADPKWILKIFFCPLVESGYNFWVMGQKKISNTFA
jgi:hypothetical protein